MKKSSFFTVLLTLATIGLMSFTCFHTKAQNSIQYFKLQQVKLLPSDFKSAQQIDLNYMLSLDTDRLLAPYLKAAGLDTLKANYGNWENTGLDGHIGGHYLSALSNMYASTGDARMNQRLEYMLAQLKRCQDKIGTGYLGGMPGGIALWKDIEQGKIITDDFALNGKWVPLYNLHKLFAGLRDAYLIAGKESAKVMLIRLTDFINNIANKLTDEQIQTMLVSEHGSLNEIFADVAAITGDKKYLELAKRFSHRRILEPLLARQDQLTGLHANMQIPKAVGFKRIAEVGGDEDYLKAAQFFWETVVKNRTVVIGGNSNSEHFHPANDFSPMINDIAGPETCNTYNMLKLTKSLFQTSEQLTYVDYYERALYNHILSSQHPTHGGFVYYTSMRPRHYRVYSQAQQCMWCCVGSGMENHGKYGELIYSHKGNDIFVNLFIPSRLVWKAEGVTLVQQTRFPDSETTELTVENTSGKTYGIMIRYPQWAGKIQIVINGKKEAIDAKPDTYIRLERVWKKGDKISIKLPMTITTEGLPDGSNYVAFLHGPIVLAAKTDTTDLDNLIGDANQFGGYRARGKTYPFETMPVLQTENANLATYLKPVAGKSQTFVAPELISPAKYKNLELIPFYRLHDARYMIYWQLKKK
ncbi:glycoside hydrolase family 127 protein [Flectobacillus rivi]|uniref:Glycoside hydrolase family 127 protein n=1 Tax=Flectobacillus rivi TaxID=2984209 RepID=A0ABT6Z1E8_9BACT|nr:glycoside hydrolase family 127 protein [Flectobacillus rivi]MDI9874903.1 glycoside hydrolase family 127 protein [Flectobacillus rivi]